RVELDNPFASLEQPDESPVSSLDRLDCRSVPRARPLEGASIEIADPKNTSGAIGNLGQCSYDPRLNDCVGWISRENFNALYPFLPIVIPKCVKVFRNKPAQSRTGRTRCQNDGQPSETDQNQRHFRKIAPAWPKPP